MFLPRGLSPDPRCNVNPCGVPHTRRKLSDLCLKFAHLDLGRYSLAPQSARRNDRTAVSLHTFKFQVRWSVEALIQYMHRPARYKIAILLELKHILYGDMYPLVLRPIPCRAPAPQIRDLRRTWRLSKRKSSHTEYRCYTLGIWVHFSSYVHTYTYTYTFVYIYMCMYTCVLFLVILLYVYIYICGEIKHDGGFLAQKPFRCWVLRGY